MMKIKKNRYEVNHVCNIERERGLRQLPKFTPEDIHQPVLRHLAALIV